MQSDTLDNRIAALEQKIQDVEADISKAENKVEIAADKGSSDELNYWRNKEHELRKKENLLREKEARMQAQQQAQGEIPDSSWSDCATMLGGLPPEVPRTIDDFQQYLLTGTVALTPSFRSRLVATCPVQDYTFAAASEGSILAMKMTSLVGDYDSAADYNEEVTGQYMTAFTAGIWRSIRKFAPIGSEFEYTLRMDRNKRPSESMTDVSTTLGSTRPDLIVIIDRLLMFVGEEKAGSVGRQRALHDIMSKIGALSPLFYQDIPYMPVYAAAGDEIQFGFMLANGEVKMSRRVFKLTDVAHRVQCLAASVALYRLFATLLKLAPDMDQRAALFFPLARPHSTFITYIPGKHGAGDVVRKEIFDFARYTDEFNLDLLVLQRAYEVANSCEHMVHASGLPRLRQRLRPDCPVPQQAYFVQLTTVGWHKPIKRWTLPDLQAATYAVVQAAAVLHSHSLVHTDLRAGNILWRHGKPFLTDLEQVHRAGFEAKDLVFSSWTTSTRDENGCYTQQSDIEQIGMLMHEWETASKKQLQGPARNLMELLRTKNLTARAAALHSWFNVSPG